MAQAVSWCQAKNRRGSIAGGRIIAGLCGYLRALLTNLYNLKQVKLLKSDAYHIIYSFACAKNLQN